MVHPEGESVSNFEEFLQQNSDVGRYDSTGKFEIAGDKALEKLIVHAVSEPSQWILKMVQAAVVGQADRLTITHGRSATTVQFYLPVTPTVEEFEEALFNLEATPSPFLQHLCFGVRALLGHQSLRVSWKHTARAWSGTSWQTVNQSDRTVDFQVEVLYEGWWNSERAPSQAEESRLLHLRAAYAPIPVVVDGRELSVENLPPNSAHLRDHAPNSPWYLAAGYLDAKGALAQPRVQESSPFNDPIRSGRPMVFWPRPETGCGGSFGLFLRQSRDNVFRNDRFEIRWTRHGILAHTRIGLSAGSLGGFLQISGDHLRSDLSVLSLEVDEAELRRAWKMMGYLRPVGATTSAAFAVQGNQAVVGDLPVLAATAVGTLLAWGAMLCIGVVIGFAPNLDQLLDHKPKTTPKHVSQELSVRLPKLLQQTLD